jgi:hypothetical protein
MLKSPSCNMKMCKILWRDAGLRHQWLTHIILATRAEIRRITVWSQSGQIVHKTLSWKYLTQKKGWHSGSNGRATVQQVWGSELKSQNCKRRRIQMLTLQISLLLITESMKFQVKWWWWVPGRFSTAITLFCLKYFMPSVHKTY